MNQTYSLDIAMISCVFPDQIEESIRNNTKSAFQNAANSYQKAVINGIEHNNVGSVRLFNAKAVGTFPKYYKHPFVKGIGCFGEDNLCYDVSFFNLPFFTNKTKYYSLKQHIRDWCISDNGKPKVLIGYAMLEYVLKGLSLAKRYNPNIVTCLIVPDLPENMFQNSKSFLKERWRLHMDNLYRQAKKYIDCYAIISEQCAEKLCVNTQYIVLEGILDSSLFKSQKQKYQSLNKAFMYSGGLYDAYGVKDMVESFQNCQRDDISLHIYGDGPLMNYITEVSNKDNRINYHGLISREECIRREQEAYALINPRKPSRITPYSFPSKVLEYLASGTPTLCYALEGISKDYYPYLFMIEETKDGLSKAIEMLCEMDEDTYISFGQSAREYVLQKKTEQYQAGRLLQLVKELVRDDCKK